MSAPPVVSVVITSYNTRALLESCLASLLQDLEGSGLLHEVIVVDDASTDGSAEMVATRFPQVRLLRQTANQGYARSNNAGVRAASGSAILLLNSDTVVQPGAMRIMYQALSGSPHAAAVGPKLLNTDGSIQQSCWRFPLTWLVGNTLWLFRLGLLDDYRSWDGRSDREVDWASSAALMVKRSVLDIVGLLDEAYGLYGVDADWAFRARRRGYGQLLLSGAEIIHYGRASWGDARDRMHLDHLRGHERFFRKHYALPGLFFYRGVVLVNSAARVVFWGIPYALGRRQLGHKIAHFKRLLRWSVLGDA